MILSMTGYGKATAHYHDKKITAEIKSLNSKALDLQTRTSPLYRDHEMELRQTIASALERGKVDFSLYIESGQTARLHHINRTALADYHQQLASLCKELDIEEPEGRWLPMLVQLPDVLEKADEEELTAEEWAVAQQVASEAIAQLMEFRRQEGAALQRKLEEKIANIRALAQQLLHYESQRVSKIRSRITEGLSQIRDVEYDRGRLEQEMIYYIEKLDISEEKQRLANHLDYFLQTMEEGHGQGKKLGFIAQEMGREINTTGSKSNLAEMQNIVVQMKDELEQIKEQVLNIM